MSNLDPTKTGWIGIDLDGTLAEYNGWMGADHIGKPVESTCDFVRWLLSQGYDVRIFTARVGPLQGNDYSAQHAAIAIRAWCIKHLGRELPVTHEKDFHMQWLYDDRCTQVLKNQGKPVDPPPPYENLAPHSAMKPTKERKNNGPRKDGSHGTDPSNGSPAGAPDPGAGPAPS